MATPFLAVNYRDGTTPKVKRYAIASPGDPVPGEASFGALDTSIGGPHSCVDNKVVQFGGNKTWLSVAGNQIYRTTDGGLTWTSVKTLTGASTGENAVKSGLFVIDLSSFPTACIFYLTSTIDAWRGTTSTDGITWTDSPLFSALATTPGSAAVSAQVVFNNTIYVLLCSSSNNYQAQVISYSPGGNSASSLVLAIFPAIPTSFAPWRNALYIFHKITAGGAVVLQDITGGTLATVATLIATATSGPVAGARYADGFVDPVTGDLICWVYNTAALGWSVVRVSPSFAPVDITGLTRPFQLSGTTVGGNSPQTSRIRVFADQVANPGGNPDIYLYYSVDGVSSPMLVYRWQGVGAVATLEDTGGNTAHSLGICVDMDGGQYSWTPGERFVKIHSWAPVSGGIRLTFSLWSETGTDSVKVRAFTRRDAVQARCNTPTEVKTPSVGALSFVGPGNFNTGLTADNGVTTYQLTVNLIGVGFSLVERGRVILDAVDP